VRLPEGVGLVDGCRRVAVVCQSAVFMVVFPRCGNWWKEAGAGGGAGLFYVVKITVYTYSIQGSPRLATVVFRYP